MDATARKPRRRGEVLSAIASVGGEFEDWSSPGELMGAAVLPSGSIWQATDCHVIAINYYSERSEGWKRLGEDVAKGVRTCDQVDCDICQGG